MSRSTRDDVLLLAARLRALCDEARAHVAAPVTLEPSDALATPRFVDEEGDTNALPAEFATATMGHVLLGQGRRAEAEHIFRAVLAATPDDAEALRGLARLSEAT
mgnify:CR=1 FL=1